MGAVFGEAVEQDDVSGGVIAGRNTIFCLLGRRERAIPATRPATALHRVPATLRPLWWKIRPLFVSG